MLFAAGYKMAGGRQGASGDGRGQGTSGVPEGGPGAIGGSAGHGGGRRPEEVVGGTDSDGVGGRKLECWCGVPGVFPFSGCPLPPAPPASPRAVFHLEAAAASTTALWLLPPPLPPMAHARNSHAPVSPLLPHPRSRVSLVRWEARTKLQVYHYGKISLSNQVYSTRRRVPKSLSFPWLYKNLGSFPH